MKMKKIKQVKSYHIVEKGDRFGLVYEAARIENIKGEPRLVYKDKVVLDPVYRKLNILNTGRDPAAMFASHQEKIEKYGIRIIEDAPQFIDADGKQGFLYLGKIVPGLVFDGIIKLSYRHFLCREGERGALYRFCDVGYESTRSNLRFAKTAAFDMPPDFGLADLFDALSDGHPDGDEDVRKLIKQPAGRDHYVSEYDHFSAYIDDIHLTWAVNRVILGSDFNVRPLNLRLNPNFS